MERELFLQNMHFNNFKYQKQFTNEKNTKSVQTSFLIMKQLTLFALLLILITPKTNAQSISSPGLDRSPLDYAYFPDNFAHDRREGEKALVRVIYSRPQKKGREIFGNKVPYGKVWRTGANENPEIKFYQNATIAGKKVKAGTYSLFAMPGEKEWTIIINKDLDYWGAYKYKEQHDLLRVTAKTQKLDNVIEAFTIQFVDDGENKAVMKMAWDQTLVEVPISF